TNEQWYINKALVFYLTSCCSLCSCKPSGDEIHQYFHAQISAKLRQLRSELKSISKGEKSVTEYLASIQLITDILASIGDPTNHRDQLEAILDGLPDEYNALSVII
ncbi:retrovirus-related Pol polyprotein from transposon TNT 1-94, partial [Trifolium pratense]